jgi:hypothetical protein
MIMADIKKAAAAAKPVAKAVAATKPAEAKVEEKKVEAKKAVEEKKAAAPKKETAKKAAPVKKETTVKAATKVSVNLQFAGKEYKAEDFEKMAKDVWQYDLGKKAADLKSVDLYVKPEENKVYYVMNGDVTGDFDI